MWRTENVANYLLKGKQIYLEGRIETRSYEDKEGQKKYITEVVCEASKPDSARRRRRSRRGSRPKARAIMTGRCPCRAPRTARKLRLRQPPDDFNQGITDDDVPF